MSIGVCPRALLCDTPPVYDAHRALVTRQRRCRASRGRGHRVAPGPRSNSDRGRGDAWGACGHRTGPVDPPRHIRRGQWRDRASGGPTGPACPRSVRRPVASRRAEPPLFGPWRPRRMAGPSVSSLLVVRGVLRQRDRRPLSASALWPRGVPGRPPALDCGRRPAALRVRGGALSPSDAPEDWIPLVTRPVRVRDHGRGAPRVVPFAPGPVTPARGRGHGGLARVVRAVALGDRCSAVGVEGILIGEGGHADSSSPFSSGVITPCRLAGTPRSPLLAGPGSPASGRGDFSRCSHSFHPSRRHAPEVRTFPSAWRSWCSGRRSSTPIVRDGPVRPASERGSDSVFCCCTRCTTRQCTSPRAAAASSTRTCSTSTTWATSYSTSGRGAWASSPSWWSSGLGELGGS